MEWGIETSLFSQEVISADLLPCFPKGNSPGETPFRSDGL